MTFVEKGAFPGCGKPAKPRGQNMSSYTPESYYGLIPGSYREHGGPRFGLVPWPAHLRPREHADVELTKKGERHCAANAPLPDIDLKELFGEGRPPILASAGGVFFLTVTRDRASIAYTIERLINMLDAMDDDPDLEEEPDHEDGGDDEFTLGWSESDSLIGHLTGGTYGSRGGEMEPELGWTEEVDQVRRQERIEGWLAEDGEQLLGWCENAGMGMTKDEPVDECGGLTFNGDGQQQASEALHAVKPRQKPKLTYGEIAHQLPDGSIMRTFVTSADSRMPELRTSDFTRFPQA